MGLSATCFVPSSPLIVSEIIDDEAIVIDLEDGVYYSIQRVGAEVWAAVLDGMPMATLVEHLCKRYAEPPDVVGSVVADFVAELEAEGLVRPAPERVGGEDSGGTRTPTPDPEGPFEPPVFRKYTDMQELLLIDPVHEVDEAGWPTLADAPDAPDAPDDTDPAAPPTEG